MSINLRLVIRSSTRASRNEEHLRTPNEVKLQKEEDEDDGEKRK